MEPPAPSSQNGDGALATRNMLSTLTKCLSEDSSTRQAGEAELKALEKEHLFFLSLAYIVNATEVLVPDMRLRLLAAQQAKNAVPLRWRPSRHARGGSKVTEGEREDVEVELVNALGISTPVIAIQISEWIARVARIDCPEYWSSLLYELVQRLEAPEPHLRVNALTTLDMVFEQLSRRRLLQDRKVFRQVASEHFYTLYNMFEAHIPLLSPDPNSLAFVVVERCMKTMLRLILSGIENIDDDDGVHALMVMIESRPNIFLCGMGGPGVTEVQQRLSLTAAKIVTRVHNRHPIGFRAYMPFFLEVTYNQLLQTRSETNDSLADEVSFQSARFLRNVAQCCDYRISRQMIDALAAGTAVALDEAEALGHEVLRFFSPERTQALVDTFLRNIFVYSPAELQTWVADPETLMQDEEAAEWSDESARHECEELLKTLLIRDKTRVAGMLVAAVEQLSSSPSQQPLVLDACYRAIGICVYDLNEHVPFERLLRERLADVLSAPPSQDMHARVLKARAAWLVGQFVGQLSRSARQLAYSLLVPLLSYTAHDQKVALTSAKALQHLVEDLGFIGTDFVPFLGSCLSSTFAMSQQCESLGTKRDMLELACGIFQRCPVDALMPLLSDVAALLPVLWGQAGVAAATASASAGNSNGAMPGWNDDGSGSENLYRTALVLVITTIVRKLGPAAGGHADLRQLALTVIAFGTDVSNPCSGAVYMIDETCELWDVVLAASPQYVEDFDRLYPRLCTVLASDFDYLKVLYRVIEGYALLGGNQFWLLHGPPTEAILGRALETLRDRGCLATCEVIDLLLQMYPVAGPVMFARRMQALLSAAASGNESKGIAGAYVGLVLRAAVTNTQIVETQVLGSDAAIALLLELGLSTFDNMYLTRRRKLAALGMCALVSQRGLRIREVHVLVPGLFSAIVQVLAEEARTGTGGLRFDDRKRGGIMRPSDFENHVARFGEGDGADGEEGEQGAADRIAAQLNAESPGAARRNALAQREPAVCMDLRTVVQDLVGALRATGNGVYEQVMQATDRTVLAQLEELVRGSPVAGNTTPAGEQSPAGGLPVKST
jgi:hypothetical protein